MIDGFREDQLSIDVVEMDGVVVLSWQGESDCRDPRRNLRPYLLHLKDQLRGRKVRVDFMKLAYMNSATVTPLMEFICELGMKATEVLVQYRSDLQWQATSFRAMRVVARKWNNVTISGA